MNTSPEDQAYADGMAHYAYADAMATIDLKDTRKRLVNEAVQDGRKLVTIREISAIDDIPGADLIKVATVEGWKVVVKAGEFKPGDLCVFFEVDSFLPLDDLRYEFLAKNKTTWHGIEGARLKTIRLRKQLSQGLALPTSIFPELEEVFARYNPMNGMVDRPDGPEPFPLRDMNFTGVLGIMKWEKVMSAQLAGLAKGNFPSFLRKSDQERCQNMGREIFGYEDELFPFDVTSIPVDAVGTMVMRGDLIVGPFSEDGPTYFKVKKAMANRDTRYEVTLKMDGSSMTIYRRDDAEGVCSRNLDLKLEGNDDNSFVKMAKSGLLLILEKMEENLAIQGELMGPGIQGNREGLPDNEFYLYNILNIDTGQFMAPSERTALLADMNEIADILGVPRIKHVPVVAKDVTLAELSVTDMASLLAYAVGPSLNNPVREGVVFKAMDGTHQFKAISNLYLEQEK